MKFLTSRTSCLTPGLQVYPADCQTLPVFLSHWHISRCEGTDRQFVWFPECVPVTSQSHRSDSRSMETSHKRAEQCSFILNLAHSPDPSSMAVGNTAYSPPPPPLLPPPLLQLQRGPSLSCPVKRSIVTHKEQVLCSACRCPSSASHQRLKSTFPALPCLTHTPINKIKQALILHLKQWATSFSWVTVRSQSTSRTKRPPAIQQFILEYGIPIMPCGLDICFHQPAHLEVRDSQFSDLSFKHSDHSYCIIFCAEHNMQFVQSLKLASI